MILGDFNAHNSIWDRKISSADAKGKIVENLIDNNSIVFYNDGSSTYHNVHTGSSSAIDLSLVSSNIF